MKKNYTSPVCEVILTDQEELLASTVIVSTGDSGGHNDVDPGDTPPIGGGDIDDPDDFAKGGLVWDNTIFD
jgi:hypothetical protein